MILPSEAGQIVKQRLLNFVRSLSTVLAFAYCLSRSVSLSVYWHMLMANVFHLHYVDAILPVCPEFGIRGDRVLGWHLASGSSQNSYHAFLMFAFMVIVFIWPVNNLIHSWMCAYNVQRVLHKFTEHFFTFFKKVVT